MAAQMCTFSYADIQAPVSLYIEALASTPVDIQSHAVNVTNTCWKFTTW